MTQSAQSERAQTALKTSGITGAPLMSLERDDALFVLTDDMLVYQDGGGTRRVTLRDLTRIHSDQAGLLRVETPAGTALTASLLGFDVAQVQSFFKGVRSATARAKDLPDSPTPTLGGAKTFGTAPAADGAKASAPPAKVGAAPEAAVPEVAGMPAPASGAGAGAPGDDGAKTPASRAAEPGSSVPQHSATPTPPSAAPAELGGAGPREPDSRTADPRAADARKAGGSAENPVVISSSSFSPHVSKPGLGAAATPSKPDTAKPDSAKSDSARPEAIKADPARPDLRKAQTSVAVPAVQAAPGAGLPSRPAPRSAVVIPGSGAPAGVQMDHTAPDPADAATPNVSPAVAPPSASAVTALSKVAAATALARQAGTVEALAGRLRILALVLFVGALLLAFFQFTGDQALAGLWTLLSGGVGAIALLALGEMSGLLALLARAPGPLSEAATDSGHDG